MLYISFSQKLHEVKGKMIKMDNYFEDFKYFGIAKKKKKKKRLPDVDTYIEMPTQNVTKIHKPLPKKSRK